jgi:ribose transport system substrate-binding protein
MKVIVAGGQFDRRSDHGVDSLVQRKVDAILIWPLDEKGIQPAFDRAREAGIPLFVIDSPGAKPFTANFQTDDYAAGVKLAKSAATKIKASGQTCAVGIIQGVSFVPILRARNAGLEAGAKAAGCKVLDKQVNTKDNVDTARAIVSTWRTKYGSQMTGILAINDPSALAALSAVSGSFKPSSPGTTGCDERRPDPQGRSTRPPRCSRRRSATAWRTPPGADGQEGAEHDRGTLLS